MVRVRTLPEALEQIRQGCTELDLSYNRIGAEGAKELAAALKANATLTTLHLGCNLGDEGAKELAAALKANATLTTLHLGYNRIGAEGAKELAAALKANATLTTLHLYGNGIGAKGAKELAAALKANKTLTTLHLSINGIGAKGAKELAAALKANATLTTLNLEINGIGAEGAKELAAALKANATLTTLHLFGNGIGAEGAKELAAALKANKTLTTLHLGWNGIDDQAALAAIKRILDANKARLPASAAPPAAAAAAPAAAAGPSSAAGPSAAAAPAAAAAQPAAAGSSSAAGLKRPRPHTAEEAEQKHRQERQKLEASVAANRQLQEQLRESKEQQQQIHRELLQSREDYRELQRERDALHSAAIEQAVHAYDKATKQQLSTSAAPLVQWTSSYQRTRQCPSFATIWSADRPAEKGPFSLEVDRLLQLWSEGGSGRRPCPQLYQLPLGDTLTRIEAVSLSAQDREVFFTWVEQKEAQRDAGQPQFNPQYPNGDATGEKAAVLERLKGRFLKNDGLRKQNFLLAFHGCSHENADSICKHGFAVVPYRDKPWFGKGLYCTTYAEYACRYATGEWASSGARHPKNAKGEHVVIAAYVAPGMVYPVSRTPDYAHPRRLGTDSKLRDKALVNQFNSHYAFVSRSDNYQCMDGVRKGVKPDYDELVCESAQQALPAYRLYFRAA